MTTGLERRAVLVLGRGSHEGMNLAPGDLAGCDSLLVLAIGWPLTAAQQRTTDTALSLARSANLLFEAEIVASVRSAAELVGDHDLVRVRAAGGETRRIRRALGERGLSVLDER